MMEDNIFLILTGGDVSRWQLQQCLKTYKDASLICVDGALKLADEMKLKIDYLVGDYDTVSPDLIEAYREKVKQGKINTNIFTFSPEKDETDTQIAIALALAKKATLIYILGGTGTRMDHTIANIHLLLQPLKKNVNAFILNEHNRIYLKDRSFTVEKSKVYGNYFSLIPFDGHVKGVTLTGFKYNTDSIDFQVGCSLGISNELLNEEGSVDFEKGTFLVIEAND